MLAIYADGKGNIRSYRVTAWQVVRPTVVAWATASQPVPSMTLQTCIGARSQWRLDVRLVAVD
jgi:sortase (surface protein transpeptidase)